MNTKLLGLGVLLAGLFVAGCDGPADSTKVSQKQVKKASAADGHGDDGNHGDGPHGGLIVEFGKAHAEFCMDHDKKQATVYLLSEDLKKPAPIPAPKLLLSIKSPAFQTDLMAMPQPGDPANKSSRFVATNDNFAKEQEFEGTISGEFDGKPYLGDFKETAHADHTNDKK